MAQARRAAPKDVEVIAINSSPRLRRTTASLGAAFQRVLAPTAIVGLLIATTTLTFVPFGADNDTSVADPLSAYNERVANRASREFVRAPVEAATAAPSTPAAAPSTPAAAPSTPAAAPSTPAAAPSTPVAAASTPVAVPSVEVVPSVAPVATPTPVVTTPVAPPVAPVATPTPVVETPVAPPVEPTPTITTPAVDWSALGEGASSRWSTSSVNVRTGPSTDFDVIVAVLEGRELTVTDATHDGWQQVSLKNGAGWIKASFLSSDKPVVPTKAPASEKKSSGSESASSSKSSSPSGSPSAASSGTSSSSSAGTCSKVGNAEKGMTQRTVAVLRQVCANFSSVTSYGGYRAGSSGYHGSGQAIDAMVSGEAGWEVANWVRANASSLGVLEVIYSQKIWTSQRSGDGWRSMSSRGSASANHYDHVHISVG